MLKIEIGKRLYIRPKKKVAFMVSFPMEFYQEYTKTCFTILRDNFKQAQQDHNSKGKYLANLTFRFGLHMTDFIENNFTGVWEAWEIKVPRIIKPITNVRKLHTKQFRSLQKQRVNRKTYYEFDTTNGTFKKLYYPVVNGDRGRGKRA